MKKIFAVILILNFSTSFAQTCTSTDHLIDDAFRLAVNIVDINTRRGILAAGGDYGGDWTRDIAINTWNGVSLLRPDVARNSLWSVTVNKDSVGLQYWDKIIWVIAAYNHYKVTGDKVFLKEAYTCSALTIKRLEQLTFDKNYGLFRGPSVFNDGIAGYPEPVYDPLNYSSSVLDHKNSLYIKCLSTNCIYYGAYQALIEMAKVLHKDNQSTTGYQQKSAELKGNILKYFYDSKTSALNYLIDQNGNASHFQEGLGISFAVIFGIVDRPLAKQVTSQATVSRFGITSITPDFPRYSHDKPGRHNNIIWPMVNGFFARAAITAEDYETFTKELYAETHLALDEDKGNYDFREVYNPYTGKPDGGWQTSGSATPGHWESCRLQTWSATAYISMVINGLLGLRFNENTLLFKPYLPKSVEQITVKGIAYRSSILNITIKGSGNFIKIFTVDGKTVNSHLIASSTRGKHNIFIELK